MAFKYSGVARIFLGGGGTSHIKQGFWGGTKNLPPPPPPSYTLFKCALGLRADFEGLTQALGARGAGVLQQKKKRLWSVLKQHSFCF